MNIRPLKEEDIEAIFMIRAENVIRFYVPEMGADDAWKALEDFSPSQFLIEMKERHMFVGEKESEIVCFFSIELDKKDNKGYLKFLHVKYSHHKKGYGRECVDFMQSWLKENHPQASLLKVITPIPEHNRPFYEKIGFNFIESRTYKFAGKEVPMAYLEKGLE